jgi:hypothetical protein
LSKEEEDFQAAKVTLEGCEATAKVAAEALSKCNLDMEQEFVCYQAYWVDGLGTSADAISGVAASGVPVRASVWAKVTPSAPPPPPEGGEAPSTPPVTSEPPALFSDLKTAVQKAGWDSDLCLLTTLEVELPPSPVGKIHGLINMGPLLQTCIVLLEVAT